MKRHLLTYYKCKQYYEENESEKKELLTRIMEGTVLHIPYHFWPLKYTSVISTNHSVSKHKGECSATSEHARAKVVF